MQREAKHEISLFRCTPLSYLLHELGEKDVGAVKVRRHGRSLVVLDDQLSKARKKREEKAFRGPHRVLEQPTQVLDDCVVSTILRSDLREK